MILLFINIVVIIAVLSTLGSGEDFGGAFQAALFILFVLALFDIFVAIPILKAMLGKDDAPSTPAPLVMSGTMRCPTCGADATVHGDQWECGWCGDCGVVDAAPSLTGTVKWATAKGAYFVVLKEIGGNKIAVIKAIRECTGVDLKNAVDAVRQMPVTLWTNSANDARILFLNLQKAGATAELSPAAERANAKLGEYSVVLCEIGKDKIAVIKVVREWTGLSFSDTVAFVNKTPITLRATSRDNAAQILHNLQEAGATAELR